MAILIGLSVLVALALAVLSELRAQRRALKELVVLSRASVYLGEVCRRMLAGDDPRTRPAGQDAEVIRLVLEERDAAAQAATSSDAAPR